MSRPVTQLCFPEPHDPMASPCGTAHWPSAAANQAALHGHLGDAAFRKIGTRASPSLPNFTPRCLSLPTPSPFGAPLLPGDRAVVRQAKAREGKLVMGGLLGSRFHTWPQLAAWRETYAAETDGRERRG